MRLHGEAREDDPPGGVLHEALRLALEVVLGLEDVDRLVAVVHARGRAQEHGAVELLGERERVTHHLVRVRDAGRVKARHLAELGKRARVLLGLRRDGAGVVCDHDDHAALDADVLQAHEGVGGHVQAHALHGHERAGTRVRSAGRYLERGLLVNGPLHVHVAGVPLCDGLDDLRRGCAGVPRHHVHAGGERTQRHRLVSHQELPVHGHTSPPAARCGRGHASAVNKLLTTLQKVRRCRAASWQTFESVNRARAAGRGARGTGSAAPGAPTGRCSVHASHFWKCDACSPLPQELYEIAAARPPWYRPPAPSRIPRGRPRRAPIMGAQICPRSRSTRRPSHRTRI